MFFVDTGADFRPVIWSWADSKEDANGALHSERNGRFVSKGQNGGGLTQNQRRKRKKSRSDWVKRLCSELVPITDKEHGYDSWVKVLTKTRNPAIVLAEATKSIRSTVIELAQGLGVQRRLPGNRKARIVFNSKFTSESGKYLAAEVWDPELEAQRPLFFFEQMAIARRQLFAYSKIRDILVSGHRIPQWRHSRKHHSESDFITLYKTYKSQDGEPIRITLDIKRLHGGEGMRAPSGGYMVWAHNMSSTGNPGFDVKESALGLKPPRIVKYGDSGGDIYEVMGIFIT